MNNDWALLEAYATRRDEAAFQDLVRRHVDVVYGAARRMLGGPGEEAEDVTQAVFLLLARKAGGIRRNGALVGWLFRVTWYCCANVRKSEGRRRRREKEVAVQDAAIERLQEDLWPVLDEGLAGLSERERQAVLVRYLEGKTARETGVVLGISEEAAEKRVERGVAKLRGYFAKCGYAVPVGAAVAVLSGEVQAAPAGLAGSIGSGVGVSGKGAAIAKGAAAMMKWASMKMAAAAAALMIALAGAGVIAVRAGLQASPSVSAVTTVQAGEHVFFVRWDEIVKDGGAARVIAAGTIRGRPDDSSTVVEADGTSLRAALRDAESRKELLRMQNERLGWASFNRAPYQPAGQSDFGTASLIINTAVKPDGTTNVGVLAGRVSSVFLEPRGGIVRMRMPYEHQETRLQVSDGSVVISHVTMGYSGDIAVGHAIVFVGDLGKASGAELYHVSVWEAFSASDAEWAYVQRAEQAEWREKGAELLKADADRAIAWSAGGHAAERVGAKWEKSLSNGAIVRLVGVNDPAKWKFCWWDAEGLPIAATWRLRAGSMLSSRMDEQLAVAVEVEDPSVSPQTTEQQDTTQGVNGAMGDARQSIVSDQLPASGKLEIGVDAGPWNEAGNIAVGETVEAGGVQVKLDEIQPALAKMPHFNGSSWLQVEESSDPSVEVRVRAFDKAGKELTPPQTQVVLFERSPRSRGRYKLAEIVNAEAGDVSRCAVYWRRREWTSFEGFAESPQVAPDAVQAAPALVKGPAATASRPAADASTPEGLMEMERVAIEKLDSHALRALIVAHSDMENRLADALVDERIGNYDLYAAAATAFGKEDAEAGLVRAGLALHADEMHGFSWKIDGDRAVAVSNDRHVMIDGGPGSELVRINGEWRRSMILSPAFSKEQLERVPKWIEDIELPIAVKREIAKEMQAGKYKDVYATRDALLERLKAARLKNSR
jgi:RNA polymerase sigma factor (sigma-70 family)